MWPGRGKLGLVQQVTSIEFHRHPDRQLWLLSFGFALLTAMMVYLLLSLLAQQLDWRIELQPQPKAEESSVATLYLEPVTEPTAETKPQDKPFARTSPDQREAGRSDG